ncbi:MAG TPA: hypothetical protein VJK02_05660 [Anaerolineales bacterium]|nr:hypothetical protein [Anaerolineales bacterium]
MHRRPANSLAAHSALVASVFIAACSFQPHIEPLVIETVPPQPFGEFQPPLATDITPVPSPPPDRSLPLDNLTSSRAIDLCGGLQYYGDENVGTCLTPGGNTYYVWSDPSNVLEVAADYSQLDAFRTAAAQRLIAQTKFRDKLFDVMKKLAPLPLELAGLMSCGVAAVPNPGQLIAVPVCLADLVALGFTSVGVTRDADAAATALTDFYRLNLDAGYTYCRMQGGTDGQCR